MIPINDKLLRKLAAGVRPGRATGPRTTTPVDPVFAIPTRPHSAHSTPNPIDIPFELAEQLTEDAQFALSALTDHATEAAAKTLLVITPDQRILIDTDARAVTSHATHDNASFATGIDAVASIDADGNWTDSHHQSQDQTQTGTPRAEHLAAFDRCQNATLLTHIAQAAHHDTTPAETGTATGKDAHYETQE